MTHSHVQILKVVPLWRMICLIAVLTFLVALYDGSPSSASELRPARPPVKSPVSPEEGILLMEVDPLVKVELVAHEPAVVDPVAIAFDESEKMWVVEMRDYPFGPKPGEAPKSRIKILEDLNHDGLYETVHIFAEELLFATGILPWKGGAIVTIAGEVVYMKDTDGDFRADVRELWFSGFTIENPQLRANHPTLGLDHHIYIANGLRGGQVQANAEKWGREQPVVPISGMDFRFDPEIGTAEAISGVGQFGLTFNDFGNRYVCSNRNPCSHIVLEDYYLKRNPFLAVPAVFNDVSLAGADSKVFPISSRPWTTSTLHAGQFTAACGLTIYRGTLLPEKFYGNSFTCDPTGNLVHCDLHEPSGGTFTSKPSQEGVEFLASRDEWFRPVNLTTGPDGALYVVDMHRAVIEHPDFMPDELKKRPDMLLGTDRGRIYRIVAAEAPSVAMRERSNPLSESSPEQWIAALGDPNAWRRETAARLLSDHDGKLKLETLIPLVKDLALEGATPVSRVHALWVLEGWKVDEEQFKAIVQATLNDPDPRVQEQSVKIAERWLADDNELASQVVELAKSTDPRLRFQTALSLGNVTSGNAIYAALAHIVQATDDPWTGYAVLSSVRGAPGNLLAALEVDPRDQDQAAQLSSEQFATWLRNLCDVTGAQNNPEEIKNSVTRLADWTKGLQQPGISDTGEQAVSRLAMMGFVGLARGLSRRGQPIAPYFDELAKDEATQSVLPSLSRSAISLAASEQVAEQVRLDSLQFLKLFGYDISGPTFFELARQDANRTMQLAAIEGLTQYGDAGIGPMLLEKIKSQPPNIRRAIIGTLLANTQRTVLLLDAIEANELSIREFDAGQSRQLAEHRDAGIRERAQKLIAAAAPADRKKVIDEYAAALKMKADALKGKEIFSKNCTNCHKIGNLGVNVAPDIADSRVATQEALLVNILDPNRAIDNNFFSYTVITKEGISLTGILSAETATSITLKQAEGKTVNLLRNEIDEMHSDGVSLMPIGLEKNITVQQMADLISFIKNWRYLEADIPVSAGE